MSEATQQEAPDPATGPTAADVYDEHAEAVEELAERDGDVGAIFRALRRIGDPDRELPEDTEDTGEDDDE